MKKAVANRNRILSVSYDQPILKTRHYILEQAGYEVVSAFGFTEAMEQCDHGAFDLVLLGYTLPPKDKTALISALRQRCGCPILSIRKAGQGLHPEADYSVDVGEGPEAVLETVRTILSKGLNRTKPHDKPSR